MYFVFVTIAISSIKIGLPHTMKLFLIKWSGSHAFPEPSLDSPHLSYENVNCSPWKQIDTEYKYPSTDFVIMIQLCEGISFSVKCIITMGKYLGSGAFIRHPICMWHSRFWYLDISGKDFEANVTIAETMMVACDGKDIMQDRASNQCYRRRWKSTL